VENITYLEICKRASGCEGSIFSGHLAQRRVPDQAISPTRPYRAYRTTLQRRFRSGPTAPIYIQFLRDNDDRLLGLEKNEATRLLKIIKASDECAAAKRCADRLLRGIAHGREIFDQYPLISEIGKQRQSAPIYIHDAIWLAIRDSIIATSRANGGRDD
jgi:hypothetical protein